MANEDATAVNNTAEQDTAPTESAPVETKVPEVEEDTSDIEASFDDGPGFEDESDDSEETDSEQEEPDDSKPEDKPEEPVDAEETPEEKPQTKGEKRKEQLNTEIRDLVSQRNELKQQVEQMNAEVYRPATAEELMQQENPETGESYNRLEAQFEAMRQEREVEKYNNQVTESRMGLLSESQRALQEFPMFDEQSPEYNKEIAAQADEVLGKALIYDPNTKQVIGSHISPYKLYKTLADTYSAAATRGQVKGQKATEKMLIAADPATGGHQKPAPTDEGLDAFDEEAGRY